MSDRRSRIEARLGSIDQALADVHGRLDPLEALELHSAPALPSEPSGRTSALSRATTYQGEAVIGRRLRELGVAADAGVRLDAIFPRLALQGRYAYSWVEDVLDVPNDRSHVSTEVLFQATDGLSMRAGVHRQITHGGPAPRDRRCPTVIRAARSRQPSHQGLDNERIDGMEVQPQNGRVQRRR